MAELEHSYPLSSMQQGMVFHSASAPQSGWYIQQLICDLQEPLHVPAFKNAWERVVERHAIFRTSFHLDGIAEPYQRVYPSVSLPFESEDWCQRPEAQQVILFGDYLQTDRREGFQLTQAPLMRLKLFQFAKTHFKFIWTFHHALLDGRAGVLTLRELFVLYEANRKGKDGELALPTPFHDYIDWLSTQNITREESYWRDALKGFSASTPLGVDRTMPPPEGTAEEHGAQAIRLSESTTSMLRTFAEQHDITLNTVIMGAWALLLSRYSGEQDVLFGVTRTSRTAPVKGIESMIGLLINTVPFRVTIPPDTKVLTWLQELRATWLAIQDYQHTPLVDIQRWSDVSPGNPLFESLVVFEHEDLNTMLWEEGKGWDNRRVQLLQQTHYPLTVGAYGGDRLVLEIGYERQRFDPGTINCLVGHLQVLLEGIAKQPEQNLAQLPLLTTSESHQLLMEWNNTRVDDGQEPCIHQRVEAQVQRTPDAIAAVFEEQALTYRELNRRANRLAHYLRKQGVGPEVFVGLCMKPSLEMLIGLLGILKAGGAYVPLDPTYPPARLTWMIEDARVPVLVTQEDLLEAFTDSNNLHRICLKKERHIIEQGSGDNPDNQTMPDNLVYVMYTSGSTGRPKGVMITHRAIGNRLTWGQKTFHVTETDKVLQKDSVSFDTSVWKFFGPLFVGAQVVMAPSGAPQDPGWLVTLITQHQITLTGWTPSALHMFLEEPGSKTCHSLSQVLCGGESLPPSVQERFLASQNGKLHNLYGPTEASIDATTWPCTSQHNPGTIPIGRPIANTQVYVLDKHFNPAPIRVPGDLYIGGIGLARGYYRRRDLTGERFLPHPFSEKPGTRLYKTGDIAAYQPDGNLEFLGRRDQQVKLRGYRIELGEVETTLIQHPSVQEAVVLLREDRSGEKRIVAYVVLEQDYPLSIATLRNHLRQQLPNYMIPSAFVTLDALPLTIHGKVDRQALPIPDEDTVEHAEQFVAPTTPLESLLQHLWQDVLRIKPVGLHDNFFMLGGHSLLAFKLMIRIREGLQVTLPIRALFDHPTLESLAKFITEQDDVPLDQPSQPGLSPVDS